MFTSCSPWSVIVFLKINDLAVSICDGLNPWNADWQSRGQSLPWKAKWRIRLCIVHFLWRIKMLFEVLCLLFPILSFGCIKLKIYDKFNGWFKILHKYSFVNSLVLLSDIIVGFDVKTQVVNYSPNRWFGDKLTLKYICCYRENKAVVPTQLLTNWAFVLGTWPE